MVFFKEITEFGHAPNAIIKERCIYIHSINPVNRCEFVKKSSCDSDAGFVLYHHALFCEFSKEPSFDDPLVILHILAFMTLTFFLFTIMLITIDEYFCPAIGQIAKLLHMSENLAGATLLAWGNSAADIITGIYTCINGNPILMFNQILGGAMFVSSVTMGLIAISRPYYIQRFFFLRDTMFAIIAVCWIGWVTSDDNVEIWDSCSLISFYIFYMLVVVVSFFVEEKFIAKEDAVDWMQLQIQEEDKELPKITYLKDMWLSLNPFDSEVWKQLGIFGKIWFVVKTPFKFILNFLVPIYSHGIRRRGWCKLLNSMQCFLLPVILFCLFRADLDVDYFPAILIVSLCGLTVAVVVFVTSKQTKPPYYHTLFAFMALIMAIMIIYFIVKELVGLLNLVGTLLGITPQTLGITMLAWGSSMGDCLSNLAIARRGFQRMAAAGCFSSILTNSKDNFKQKVPLHLSPISPPTGVATFEDDAADTLMGMGVPYLIKNLNDKEKSKVRSGIMGPNCVIFLIISLSYTLVYILFTNFQARKSYGIFLMAVYLEFLFFCILCEFEIVHPIGTDHGFDSEVYENCINNTHCKMT